MNLNYFLLIDGSLMLIGLPLLIIIKAKRRLTNSSLSRESNSHKGVGNFNGISIVIIPPIETL